jgi:hypothetical protein
MILASAQIRKLDELVLNAFMLRESEVRNIPENSLRSIIEEAISFGFTEYDDVCRYLDDYQRWPSSFIEKESWMNYVLQNEHFSSEDKLGYIEKRLQTI